MLKNSGHKFWGTPKAVIIMTASKSVTSFFQIKKIPLRLWNVAKFVLNLIFTIADKPAKMNTVADFFSRLEFNPFGKILLEIKDDVTYNQMKSTVNQWGKLKNIRLFLHRWGGVAFQKKTALATESRQTQCCTLRTCHHNLVTPAYKG